MMDVMGVMDHGCDGSSLFHFIVGFYDIYLDLPVLYFIYYTRYYIKLCSFSRLERYIIAVFLFMSRNGCMLYLINSNSGLIQHKFHKMVFTLTEQIVIYSNKKYVR